MQTQSLPIVQRSLSEWLQVACDDLRKAVHTPGVRVNMQVFMLQADTRCYVCLAGSMLLAADLKFDRDVDTLSQVDSHTQQLMLAVNNMRLGLLRALPGNFGINGDHDDDTFNPYLKPETFQRLVDLRHDPGLMDPNKQVDIVRWASDTQEAFFASMDRVKVRLIELGL